jgi:hypothetical protein
MALVPSARFAIIGLSLLTVVLLPACTQERQLLMTDSVRNSSFDMQINYEDPIQAGKQQWVQFFARKDGVPVDLYDEGRSVHVIFASEDLQDIFHTPFPERTGVGKYEVPHTFTRPGRYRAWVEVDDGNREHHLHHGQNADLVAFTDIAVEGDPRAPLIPVVSSPHVDAQGYTLSLDAMPLRPGEPTSLYFSVKNPQGTAVHVDPAAVMFATTGEGFGFFDHGHAVDQKDGAARIPVMFPTPGRYIMLIQSAVVDGETFYPIEVHFSIVVK